MTLGGVRITEKGMSPAGEHAGTVQSRCRSMSPMRPPALPAGPQPGSEGSGLARGVAAQKGDE